MFLRDSIVITLRLISQVSANHSKIFLWVRFEYRDQERATTEFNRDNPEANFPRTEQRITLGLPQRISRKILFKLDLTVQSVLQFGHHIANLS
jgi:hypothetical protein